MTPPIPPTKDESSRAETTAGSRSRLDQLPNWLTAGRVILAIVFFTLLSWYRHKMPESTGPTPGKLLSQPDWYLLSAAAVFIIAALTDALDGHLARRWNMETVFGRVMDPFADKLLVVGAFVFLAGPGFTEETRPAEQVSGVYPWMVAVVLGRELLVTSIRSVFESQGVSFAATMSGKLKMILQCICIPTVLIVIALANPATPAAGWGGWGGEPRWWARFVIDAVVWTTVVVTAWSGAPYILRAFSAMRAAKPIA